MADHSFVSLLFVQQLFMTGWTIILPDNSFSHFFQHTQQSAPCSNLTIYDPLFDKQWYLKGSPKYGINVIPAWRKCYNGTGITVGVVDTGIDTSNADLAIDKVILRKPNIQLQLQHGTQVAGLIAAKANNHFGRGIAFGAKLADLAYVKSGQNIPIAEEALSVTETNSNIDIFSCSFSRSVDGKSVYKIPPGLRQNMHNGATTGRSNKGAIYVVSSGNGGQFFVPESCAYDEFMNSIHAILVAGIDHRLGTIPAGEKCSAILVAAPTRSLGFNNLPKMITTSGRSYTGNFGMTSAAVAVASGAIAVMLSARPELTNRDVMHILTRTARTNRTLSFQATDAPFKCNNAGFDVSLQYGFGLLDVEAMVEEASKWTTVGNKITCTASYQYTHFPMHGDIGQTIRLNINNLYNGCRIQYLEHVEMRLIMDDSSVGSITVDLESPSPSAFSSNILPGRVFDHRTSLEITVTSVQFWGHDPRGQWVVALFNRNLPLNGTVHEIRLTFHGLENAPARPLINPCRPNGRVTRGVSNEREIYTGTSVSQNGNEPKTYTTTGIVIGISIGVVCIVGIVATTAFILQRKKLNRQGK